MTLDPQKLRIEGVYEHRQPGNYMVRVKVPGILVAGFHGNLEFLGKPLEMRVLGKVSMQLAGQHLGCGESRKEWGAAHHSAYCSTARPAGSEADRR